MTMTMTMNGERYIVVPEPTFERMMERLEDVEWPQLPPANEHGHRPARETGHKLLARKIIQERVAVGWTRDQLAAQAGVTLQEVAQLEAGDTRPDPRVVDAIDRALAVGESLGSSDR